MSDKVKKALLILSAFLIILMVAVVAYLVKQNRNLKVQATISPIATSTLTETITPTQTIATTKTSTPAATATIAERSKIELIKDLFATKFSLPASQIDVTISKESANSAFGSVSTSEEGGGGWFVAAKSNGEWKILQDGNGTINCGPLEGYDVPSSVVAECYDMATDNLIKR